MVFVIPKHGCISDATMSSVGYTYGQKKINCAPWSSVTCDVSRVRYSSESLSAAPPNQQISRRSFTAEPSTPSFTSATMSLARTPNALRKWPCLYDNPISLSTSYIRNNTRFSDNRAPGTIKHKTPSPQTTRPFHCTASCYAARSPAARRAQAQTQRLRPVYSSDGLFNLPAHGDLTARLKYLDEKGPLLWMSALAEGLLDDKVTKNTFLDIAKRLLETAHRELPSADAIRGLSSGASDTTHSLRPLQTRIPNPPAHT